MPACIERRRRRKWRQYERLEIGTIGPPESEDIRRRGSSAPFKCGHTTTPTSSIQADCQPHRVRIALPGESGSIFDCSDLRNRFMMSWLPVNPEISCSGYLLAIAVSSGSLEGSVLVRLSYQSVVPHRTPDMNSRTLDGPEVHLR